LVIANKELVFQNDEKEKRATELAIANKELVYQNEQKENRAAELVVANKELAFQNDEKEKRAAELVVANKELVFQNKEKEKRAAELVIANKELIYQNEQKENRATELVVANKELVFQNEEKGKRAAELAIANKALVLQNQEKEKHAVLAIANKELAIQNEEKETRAAELLIANKELEKAKQIIAELNINLEHKIADRTIQLEQANKELESFSYSVSHDLRAPLRGINGFTRILAEDYIGQLDDEAKDILAEIIESSKKMGQLIDNLLEFSRIGKQSVSMVNVNIDEIGTTVIKELKEIYKDRKITVITKRLDNIRGDRNMLRQVFINLVSNAFKYTGKKVEAVIEIGSYYENGFCTFYIKDNGAGFDMHYYDKLFGVFQRLHSSNEFEGTGVGLAIIQRIIAKHGGQVWAEGKVDEGACFYISLPG